MSARPDVAASALGLRRRQLADAMRRDGFDALLVVGAGLLKHHRYVDWLLGTSPLTRPVYAVLDGEGALTAFVLSEGDAALVRDATAASAGETDVRIAGDQAAGAVALLRERGLSDGRVGIVGRDDLLPVGAWMTLVAGLPCAGLEDASSLADEAMAVKTADDIACVRGAAQIAAATYRRIAERVRPGEAPADLAALGHGEARRLGARDALVFVGAGLHHGADQSPLPLRDGGLVTIYVEVLGPGGYWAEEVGMVALGALDPAREKVAAIALEALAAAERVLFPGTPTADAAAAMAEPARRAGLVTGLGHSLAHGVGVGDDDAPRVAEGDGGVLRAGMTLVVHPNVADPSVPVSATAGGTYLIEDDGPVRLCAVPSLRRVGGA